MPAKIPVIIDADPGIDDAMALIMAMHSQRLDIKLITTAEGNVGVEPTQNTLHLVEKFGKNIPVAKGSERPLYAEVPYNLRQAHGGVGLGAYTYAAPKKKVMDLSAVEAMYRVLKNSSKKITIISLAPMTNIAKLILQYPDCVNYIKEIVFMGGSKEAIIGYNPETGENEPYPEFNINFDPDAAEVVITSGIPCTMVAMEMGHNAFLNHKDIKKLKKMNATGAMLSEMFKDYHDGHVNIKDGAATHDGTTIAYVTNPELFKEEKAYLYVLWFKNDRNATLNCNLLPRNAKGNHWAVVDINIEGFKDLVFELIKEAH